MSGDAGGDVLEWREAEIRRLRATIDRLAAALEATGKGSKQCWCAGWASLPCIDQPQCKEARAALAAHRGG